MLSKIILIEKGSRCLPAGEAYFRIQGAKIALTAFLEMIVDSDGNSVHKTDGSPCSLRIRETEFAWRKAINLSCGKDMESIENNIEIRVFWRKREVEGRECDSVSKQSATSLHHRLLL